MALAALLPRNNPILRREWNRFSRRWLSSIVPVVIIWCALSWLFRRVLPSGLPGMAFWQYAIVDTLQMIVRADLVVALFIVYRSASETKWHHLREELAVRFLTPGEILLGKAMIPIAALVLLNLSGWWIGYWDIVRDPSLYVTVSAEGVERPSRRRPVAARPSPLDVPREVEFVLPDGTVTTQTLTLMPAAPAPAPRSGVTVSVGIPVMLMGLLEDFLYSTIMVLIAMRQYLFRHDAIQATMAALGRIALVALPIALAGWLYSGLFLLFPGVFLRVFPSGPIADLLIPNAIWFAFAIPFEAAIILRTWWLLRRDAENWLHPDDSHTSDSGTSS